NASPTPGATATPDPKSGGDQQSPGQKDKEEKGTQQHGLEGEQSPTPTPGAGEAKAPNAEAKDKPNKEQGGAAAASAGQGMQTPTPEQLDAMRLLNLVKEQNPAHFK